uniref:Uncharacterized protein n=1 Tax=Globisporangium ultimum (strain ATCC 200006 / CBS 805.95 / DAOM BR144) TaxID=431595 RepID=K3WSL9_GLOUD
MALSIGMSTWTNTTCSYGVALTAEGCVRTLASFHEGRYRVAQAIYCIAGFLAWLVCGYKFVEAMRNNGGILQRRIFMLCMYASLTIMARGVDPGSYGHFTPRPLSHFFINSCTATLYTI